jgi:rhamnogalacturonan endolyase
MLRVLSPPAMFLLLTLLAGSVSAQSPVELFRDDFSRYPPGLLSEPLGRLNPAVQEYHYLAHRGVPTAPWANAICYLDAWAGGDEDGRPYLEQHLPPGDSRMMTRIFSPLFVTGDPEWADYTVEVAVRPLSLEDMAGVVFRYHTNRHHYLFSLQDGKQARLALRLPIEEKYRVAPWRELGTAPFSYDTDRYYRLKVESRGPRIRAYIDDKLILSAEDAELPRGLAGLSANIPARYRDFKVSCDPETKRDIDRRIWTRTQELTRLQDENPRPKLWKQFETPKFGAGRNARFGDLDGDGATDMLICQNVAKVNGGDFVEISCLTALNLDGKILWQLGRPDPRNGLLTSDCPFQIHDIDGDGRNEVVLVKDFKIQVLDGATGSQKAWAWMPEIPQEKEAAKKKAETKKSDNNKDWRYTRVLGDAIAFANISGKKSRTDLVIKDRYDNFWVFDNALKLLWGGQGQTGHYPYIFAGGRDGRDRIAIGYALWDHDGTQLWSHDTELKDHADAISVANLSADPKRPPRAYYSGSDEGFMVVDDRGALVKHVRIGHAQNAAIGKFRTDLPGLQYATINFWKNPGIVTLFDADGAILTQGEPIHSGSSLLPVNWRGDGQELLLLSGNPEEGGMIDGQLRRAVVFPADGHPDLCAAVRQVTGDPRDEIILWDRQRVWIYTQDRPFKGSRIYAPLRNPDYNDSNYRAEVSLPNWEAVPGSN